MSDAGVLDRALGAYLGLAIGDALGATVEFMTPREIAHAYGVHRRIVGGGWLGLAPGAVTDDTEMSLALGRAIVARGGFDGRSVAEAFFDWLKGGPIDCGHTCRRGIRRYALEGTLEAPPNEGDAGNGALMRNLPVVLSSLGDDALMRERTVAQCHITHNHPYSDQASLCFGRMTMALVLGQGVEVAMRFARELVDSSPVFAYAGYGGRATAYVVDTVCTVLHAFETSASFEATVVETVNRGDDADTTGALAGMLAGARHGSKAIPGEWLRRLAAPVRSEIEAQVPALIALSPYAGGSVEERSVPARRSE